MHNEVKGGSFLDASGAIQEAEASAPDPQGTPWSQLCARVFSK
jgi:hypothetical protein